MTARTTRSAGRIRLRFSQLKRDGRQLRIVADALYLVDGIIAIEKHAITGSLLIHYDASERDDSAFWHEIQAILLAHSLQDALRLPSNHAGLPSSAIGGSMADAVAKALIERLLERSAVALLAALL